MKLIGVYVDSFLNSSQMYSWKFAFFLASIFIVLIVGPFFLIPVGPYLLLYSLAALVFIAPLESLLLTPVYRLSGRFIYLSPMLFATNSSKSLELHIGTLFDYASHLHKSDLGKRAQIIVLKNTLIGLLSICENVRNKNISVDTELNATSYFFSSRTAEKLGFRLVETGFSERMNLYSVYTSLLMRLSFTRGKFTFPNIREIRKITTTTGELYKHREYIKQMLTKVDSRLERQACD